MARRQRQHARDSIASAQGRPGTDGRTDYDKQHPEHSIIKSHMGINGGVTFHPRTNLHFDLDYVRAHVVNSGMVFDW